MTAVVAIAGLAAALFVLGVAEALRSWRGDDGGRRLTAVGIVARLARIGLRWRDVPDRRWRPAHERLMAAGDPWGLGPREYVAARGVAAVGCGALGFIEGSFGSLWAGVAVGALFGAAGYFLPEVLLARRIRLRGRQMATELPDLLDLVRACVRAGLPLQRAMSTVASKFDGPLARELRRTALDQQLGTPRGKAMGLLSLRVAGSPEVVAFLKAVERSERRGVPVGELLASQAREARDAQSRRIQERAARAGPKIQLVVALVLVPAVLMMVAAVLLTKVTALPL